jgi:hypothetical protein
MQALVNEETVKQSYTQTRLALLEQAIGSINTTLIDLKLDLRDIDTKLVRGIENLDRKFLEVNLRIDKLREEFYTFNKWLIGIAISGFVMTLTFGAFVVKFFD